MCLLLGSRLKEEGLFTIKFSRFGSILNPDDSSEASGYSSHWSGGRMLQLGYARGQHPLGAILFPGGS